MSDALVCWKCGASIEELPQPMGRTAECLACQAELHVCRMCLFYDPSVSQACRETVADYVKDKQRANFCGYFQARPGAFLAGGKAAAEAARSQLDALFGESTPPAAREADVDTPPSEEELAKKRLEDLFRK